MKIMLEIFGVLVVLGFIGMKIPEDSASPVIVELFTAEGCSSCPPADDLLKEMSEILNKEGKHVVGLSFHVTYWNRLGWVDPYSEEQFTNRQKKYSEALKTQQLYTPQAIVNGSTEFVGSNPMAFRDQVTKASEKAYSYKLDVKSVSVDGKLTVQYDLGKEPKQTVLNIAVVENFVKHLVPRGENKDRTLQHTNVVRSFETITPQKSGEVAIKLPPDIVSDRFKIVIYTQNVKTMQINGAAEAALIL
ncbi:MAG: DUF1223 domain-containing protein [Chryseolinea sp.]